MNATVDEAMERLAHDVSFLGRVLGDVLREQGGDELFDAVEGLRVASRHHRQYHHEELATEVAGLIQGLSLERCLEIVRAFTMYFHLINIAEENHRVRRLHEREAATPGLRPDSIRSAVRAMHTAGITDSEARRLFQRLSIRPVFTAHPTEARRMTLMRQLRRIAQLVRTLDGSSTLGNRENLVQLLYAEVTNLWQTNELRTTEKTAMDEVRNGLYYFDSSVFGAVARLYREMRDAVRESYAALEADIPVFLSFGSWIGGDRDGNPNVTAAVTQQTMRLHRDVILGKYIHSTQKLVERLTTSERLAGYSQDLSDSLQRDQDELEEEGVLIRERWAEEPYRQKLSFVVQRLQNARAANVVGMTKSGDAVDKAGYSTASEFLSDLQLVHASLQEHGGARIADQALQDLIWQASVFGFHLAKLDVRQHRDRHVAAIAELLPHEGFPARDEYERTRLLDRLMSGNATLALEGLSPETRETMEVFHAIRKMQDEFGVEAIDTCIVSFTAGPSDVLAALFLGTLAGLGSSETRDSRLKIVPLFETGSDLEAAPGIMKDLYSLESYKRQLDSWNSEQEIMLGYSDSDKDAGYLSSNVWLYRAQQRLCEVSAAAEIRPTFFHGRGGAIGRGGGPLQRAILGQPRDTIAGSLKVTEQGEVLFTRYGNPDIAHRHLEQLVNAVLVTQLPAEATPAQIRKWEDISERLSDKAAAVYQGLVSGDPAFLRFFDEGTPLRSIMRLRIASRPPKRGTGDLKLDDLRAIPWVFAWTQARWGLPGWYGLGTALEQANEAGAADELREMYRFWPFFRWVVDAAQISLGKADLGIAREYSHLVTDEEARERYTELLAEEFERTVRMVCLVTEREHLLDSWPILQRSIALRNPYVDPMSYVQIRSLRMLRASPEGAEADVLRSIIDRSVTGVAAGLQNTG